MGRIIVVMGVCGSGKSTVGQLLASKLGCRFVDGDDFHSIENRNKMTQGVPLDDQDRLPWLKEIHREMLRWLETGEDGVIACSALKYNYREILRYGCIKKIPYNDIGYAAEYKDSNGQCHKAEPSNLTSIDLTFVFLKGSHDLIASRMQGRDNHFMPSTMLRSQLDTLEEPTNDENHITVDISSVSEHVMDIIFKSLRVM